MWLRGDSQHKSGGTFGHLSNTSIILLRMRRRAKMGLRVGLNFVYTRTDIRNYKEMRRHRTVEVAAHLYYSHKDYFLSLIHI